MEDKVLYSCKFYYYFSVFQKRIYSRFSVLKCTKLWGSLATVSLLHNDYVKTKFLFSYIFSSTNVFQNVSWYTWFNSNVRNNKYRNLIMIEIRIYLYAKYTMQYTLNLLLHRHKRVFLEEWILELPNTWTIVCAWHLVEHLI